MSQTRVRVIFLALKNTYCLFVPSNLHMKYNNKVCCKTIFVMGHLYIKLYNLCGKITSYIV